MHIPAGLPWSYPKGSRSKVATWTGMSPKKEKQDTPTLPDSSPGSGLYMRQQLCQTTMRNILLVAICYRLSADCTTVEVGKTLPRLGGIRGTRIARRPCRVIYTQLGRTFSLLSVWMNKLVAFSGPSNDWVNREVSDIHRWEETKFMRMDILWQIMYFQQNTQQLRQGWHCCALTASQNRERWQEGQRVFSQRSSSTISTLVHQENV